ncbi:hypothetical protein AU476_10360 [Cupriavidus sp. UYMSc13B]|nr:hypothetical protein AU476_10360 [Cupriavidus sp. UYMSc13B]
MYREQVRMHLRTSIADARYAHDRAAVGALTRSRRTVAAACHRADREATIHPAFAPPAVVI